MTISKSASWAKLDNETVIINNDTQKCLILDESGSEIWEVFLSVLSYEQTIMNITEKYSEADSETIRIDITEMYELLVENGIVLEDLE